MPATRLSAAAVSQLVQPRLLAPVTTNFVTGVFHSFVVYSPMASIALTALLVIGKSKGQLASPVSRYLTKVCAISASSLRSKSGWFGTLQRIADGAPARFAI